MQEALNQMGLQPYRARCTVRLDSLGSPAAVFQLKLDKATAPKELDKQWLAAAQVEVEQRVNAMISNPSFELPTSCCIQDVDPEASYSELLPHTEVGPVVVSELREWGRHDGLGLHLAIGLAAGVSARAAVEETNRLEQTIATLVPPDPNVFLTCLLCARRPSLTCLLSNLSAHLLERIVRFAYKCALYEWNPNESLRATVKQMVHGGFRCDIPRKLGKRGFKIPDLRTTNVVSPWRDWAYSDKPSPGYCPPTCCFDLNRLVELRQKWVDWQVIAVCCECAA